MRGVAGAWAAALLAAVTVGGAARAEPAPESVAPSAPSQWLLFAGADLWHSGSFIHGGLLWSPEGLDREGFTLKLLGGAGTYRYRAGGLGGVDISATQMLGAVMPGWRLKYDRFEIVAYAGLDVQDHRLSLNDPANSMRGTHFGLRAGADIWYEILPSTMMLAANASISTIGTSYWTRIATGWRVFEMLWFGPEAQAMGGPTYRQWRVGVHGTSYKTGNWEWSAGLGFATDSERRNGFYARLGVLTRR